MMAESVLMSMPCSSAVVANVCIVGRTKTGVGPGGAGEPVGLVFAHEQQNPAAALFVVDVALAGGGTLRRGALALPVEQLVADGIVVVHRGRGIVLVGLVQRHEEQVQILFRQPLHPLAHGGGLQKVQGHQDLVAGIGAVQVQRAVEADVHRRVEEVDPVILVSQQLDQFSQQHRAVGQRGKTGCSNELDFFLLLKYNEFV